MDTATPIASPRRPDSDESGAEERLPRGGSSGRARKLVREVVPTRSLADTVGWLIAWFVEAPLSDDMQLLTVEHMVAEMRYLDEQDAWYNFDNGLLFVKIDLCCNRVPLKDTLPTLQHAYDNPNTREVMDLGTHEQYFWPFYESYRPDHAQRLDTAIRFVTEHGYEPVFFHEGLMGGKE